MDVSARYLAPLRRYLDRDDRRTQAAWLFRLPAGARSAFGPRLQAAIASLAGQSENTGVLLPDDPGCGVKTLRHERPAVSDIRGMRRAPASGA